MAIGTLTALAIAGSVALGAGAGVGISKLAGGGSGGGVQAPQALPAAPNVEDAASKAQGKTLKRKAQLTNTTYNQGGALGIGGQADVIRKTLTGQ